MDPSGNTYDDTTNTMTVGSIENCLTLGHRQPEHAHSHTHLVIQNVKTSSAGRRA